MRVAAVQLNSQGEKASNLATAERLVRDAASGGAELVVLPEKWNLFGPADVLLEGAEPLDGESLGAARSWARELGISLLAGSIAERPAKGDLLRNTSVLISPDGADVTVYRKIHMFDVDVGGIAYRESEHEQAGEEIATGPAGELELGLSVCYDLRFPELYRILALRGALAVSVPSAFTLVTGRDHWRVLLRARAIENQIFVIAANQWGAAPPHYESYGRSAIVDPWGVVIAQAPDGEHTIVADLDLDSQARVRRSLPSLANRRPAAYRWPEAEGQGPRLAEASA